MKKVVIALGCSWTVGHEIEEEFPNQDVETVRSQYRYAELLRSYLKYDEHIVCGLPGGSNERAIRLAYPEVLKYIFQGYKVFVVFGITSVWRTELYDVATKDYIGFIYGNDKYYTIRENQIPPATKDLIKNYKIHTFDEEFHATRQAIDILGFHSFLKLQNVEHVFFDIFEPKNSSPLIEAIPKANYIWQDEIPLQVYLTEQYRASGSHPNVAGHKLIARRLYQHLINGSYNL
jgi:hypothetical protein